MKKRNQQVHLSLLFLLLKGSRVLSETTSELNYNAAASEVAVTDTEEGVALVEETERVQEDEEQTRKDNLTKKETSATYNACLTIQPNRILCGVRVHKG